MPSARLSGPQIEITLRPQFRDPDHGSTLTKPGSRSFMAEQGSSGREEPWEL
jgi:hypothetical protein